jgi:hypothetical protein
MDNDGGYDDFERLVDMMYDAYMDEMEALDAWEKREQNPEAWAKYAAQRQPVTQELIDAWNMIGDASTEYNRRPYSCGYIDPMNGTHIKDIGDHNTFPTIEEYWGPA